MMTSLFLGQILVTMAGARPATKPATKSEATPEPMCPGAWATWAKAARDEAASLNPAQPKPRLTARMSDR